MFRTTRAGLSGAVGFVLLFVTSAAAAAGFMKYDGVDGEAKGPDGHDDWIVVEEFSLGVEREMKESGEKGGTADINIGVGELQECTISKSMDRSSPALAQYAINGNSLGRCQICLSDSADASGVPNCYAHYVMDRCFVRSWKTHGDADDRPTEEVAFYYNKIAFATDSIDPAEGMNWDRRTKRPWPEGLDWLFDFGPGAR